MPERTFTLEIVTPDRVVLSDNQIVSLIAPGTAGYLGILANHAPLMTELRVGEMTVRRADGSEEHLATTEGFMEVSENKVTILTDTAEKAEEIDIERAREAVRRAQELLAQRNQAEVDATLAEAALERALNRLHVAEKSM